MDRRSAAQREFDLAIKGWAFCNDAMLMEKIKRCKDIACKLDISDPRHRTLQAMRDCI